MPLPSIEAPDIRLVSDVILDGKRHLALSLNPGRGARGLRLWDAGGAKIQEERLDGKAPRELIRFSREADEKLYRMLLGETGAPVWHMDFWGAGAQAMRLDLIVDTGSPVLLHAVSERDGFPTGVSIPPRPKNAIPRMDSDVTLVGKRFAF
jgi:hypothetical protein